MGARLGLAIKKVDVAENQDHVGLLYEDSTGLRFCHFAWHLDLKDWQAPADYFSKACDSFVDDPINTELAVAHAISVRTHKNIIAYGFGYEHEVFGAEGQLISLAPGSGLTCATFIIAFFSSLGFQICDQSSWIERAEDRDWQKQIMRRMAKSGDATCAHLWEMRRHVGTVRFRPDEVAVCGTSLDIPVGFASARELADELQGLLA